jgi:hypothetical protein
VPKTFDQVGAVRALGIGVGFWVAAFLMPMLGGPFVIAWPLFMIAAAIAGVFAIVRTWRAGTWPVAVVLPVAMLFVVLSALGVSAPFAM